MLTFARVSATPGDPFSGYHRARNLQPQRPGRGAAKTRDCLRQVIDKRVTSPDFAKVPGGTTGLLIKDYKGTDADQPVYQVNIVLLAELRGYDRQAAEELSQWKTRVEE
jgi:hypothetical protein